MESTIFDKKYEIDKNLRDLRGISINISNGKDDIKQIWRTTGNVKIYLKAHGVRVNPHLLTRVKGLVGKVWVGDSHQ